MSAITLAEISIKQSVEKLHAPLISDDLVAEQGMVLLPFETAHARKLRELPLHHRDPFDRMLIAQATVQLRSCDCSARAASALRWSSSSGWRHISRKARSSNEGCVG